jgi:hypothetical protein
VTIDLEALHATTGLREDSAIVLELRAAVALQRRHRSGVRLIGDIRAERIDEEIVWRERASDIAVHEDFNRATEEGAEAIALALAGVRCSWRVRRRLQSTLAERADWLLVDPATGAKILLEVAGTDAGDLGALLKKKIIQARSSPFSESSTPAACVVRFFEPQAIFWSDDGPR